MRGTMPKAFSLFEEIHDATRLAEQSQDQLTQLVRQYSKRFGQVTPMEVLQGPMSTEEINALLKEAIADGAPVSGWAGKAFTCISPLRPAKAG